MIQLFCISLNFSMFYKSSFYLTMFEGHGRPTSIFIAILNVLRRRIFVIQETRRVKEKGKSFLIFWLTRFFTILWPGFLLFYDISRACLIPRRGDGFRSNAFKRKRKIFRKERCVGKTANVQQIRSGIRGRSKFVALNFILSPLSLRRANFYEIFSRGIICDGFLFQEMVRLGRDYDSNRPRM